MIRLIQRRGWWYLFSGALAVAAIISLSLWGLKLGLDFTGGSLMAVEFQGTRPTVETLQEHLAPLQLGEVVIQSTDTNGALLRFRDVTEEVHQEILTKLRESSGGEISELRFESIGPVVGSELQSSSIWAITLALFFIVSYIAWAFRKVSKPIESWKYGVVAVVALTHDVLITVGVFSALGHFYGVEIGALFVSAILTVLGFSVHDTIVVFDRTRENLFRGAGGTFEEIVNKSVNETLVRSLNTSLTTLLVLSALYLFGGDSIKHFTLALLIGIAVGTYSSIFVASPLIVDWNNWSNPAPAKSKK